MGFVTRKPIELHPAEGAILEPKQSPSKRRPLEIHSNTRRKASPGPRGCWLLLTAFSTSNSKAFENKLHDNQHMSTLIQVKESLGFIQGPISLITSVFYLHQRSGEKERCSSSRPCGYVVKHLCLKCNPFALCGGHTSFTTTPSSQQLKFLWGLMLVIFFPESN